MKLFLQWPWFAAFGLGIAVALAGCSAPARHKLLHVFFTGVDEPVAAATGKPNTVATNTVSATTNSAGPMIHFHKPYQERKCSGCHLSAQSQELRGNDAELCLTCHEKLIGNAKVIHSPIDNGKCLTCHHPHESVEEFLLKRRGRAVCMDCHKTAKLEKVKAHANIGETACISCHDPHRSEFKALLRKAQQ